MSFLAKTHLLAFLLLLCLHELTISEQPAPKDKKEPNAAKTAEDAALIGKLIQQLGSSKFAEREAARIGLEKIGDHAIDPLRTAAKANTDLETRRRAEQLADQLDWSLLQRLVQEGVEQHKKKDFKKAAESFDRAIIMGKERFHPHLAKAPPGDVLFLTELFLHSARTSKELADHEKAAKAYHGALYYSNYNRDKRAEIDREWAEMTTQLLAVWKDSVRAKKPTATRL
jgi:hypothetical protein